MGGIWATLKRSALEFREDDMTDWAAALTYYGLLSLFPGLIALVSVLGLVGDPEATSREITEIIGRIGPDSAVETFSGPIESITANQSAAGVLFVVGLAVALWSASGYIGAFTRASNAAWETPEGRSFFKLRPLQVLITLVMVILLALVLISIILTGPIVDAIGNSIGLGDTMLTVWDIAKWPFLVGVAVLMFSLLYYVTPNVKVPSVKFVTPGSIFAVAAWIVASALFALYVANFGSYDKTYGTLGGLISLLVWMWITNLALLFGVEINAERERTREIESDVPEAATEIQLEPRGEPGERRTA
ncbi:MAG: YihY/virulence factor BrkB family protein [Actinomycetota bacterium]|nr:YihY/virulence factor BrkB family protein [Actinomycetota bacterium]